MGGVGHGLRRGVIVPSKLVVGGVGHGPRRGVIVPSTLVMVGGWCRTWTPSWRDHSNALRFVMDVVDIDSIAA